MPGSREYSDTWLNFSWSSWIRLDPSPQTLVDVPSSPGLYRVRHQRRDGLEYIGETENARRRIRTLGRQVHKEEMPFRDPHTAAPCLWAVRDHAGEGLEVSYTTPDSATQTQHRKGLEAALIAAHRQQKGRSPTANFGRMLPGYTQSTYRAQGTRGERVDKGGEYNHVTPSRSPPPGTNAANVIAIDWMGLTWSTVRPLKDRLQFNADGPGIYRIWYQGAAPPLAYVGESANLKDRLYDHEKTFGKEALVAIATPPDIDTSAKRKELETDLIGTHVRQHDLTPLAQFGFPDRVPPPGHES